LFGRPEGQIHYCPQPLVIVSRPKPTPEQIALKMPWPSFQEQLANIGEMDDSPIPTSGIYRARKSTRVGVATTC